MVLFFFSLFIFFVFLLNLNYLIYDESFLLGFCFLIFFILIYIFIKRNFKNFSALKILKKFIVFIFLFKINFNYNKLLGFFFFSLKLKFIKFINSLKFLKLFINNVLLFILNKYKAIVSILFLFFLLNVEHIKGHFILYFSFFLDKTNLYDNLLCS